MNFTKTLVDLAGTGGFKYPPLDWSGSPFLPLQEMGRGPKGAVGERAVAAWARAQGMVVEPSTRRDAAYDMLVDGLLRWEVKLATATYCYNGSEVPLMQWDFNRVCVEDFDEFLAVLVEPQRVRILRFPVAALQTRYSEVRRINLTASAKPWYAPYVVLEEAA